VTELETRLRALGRDLAFPGEPNLSEAVVSRLHRPPARSWRRPLLAAVALAVLALAIALAVPPARSAILRFFHLGAVSIERVETLPPARERPFTAGFGPAVDRVAAEHRIGFKMLLPPLHGSPPKRIYAPRNQLLATVLDVPVDGHRKSVLLVEIPGGDLGIAKKVAQKQTLIAPATVNGLPGLWIRGPHVIAFLSTSTGIGLPISRVSGSALVWQRGNLTLRLEGNLTEQEAIHLARSITPSGSG
jgi:hypothetical protein